MIRVSILSGRRRPLVLGAPVISFGPQVKQPKMGTMLHQLKSSLAEFAESDEVAMILKQMLQVRSEESARRLAPRRSSRFAFSSVTALFVLGGSK